MKAYFEPSLDAEKGNLFRASDELVQDIIKAQKCTLEGKSLTLVDQDKLNAVQVCLEKCRGVKPPSIWQRIKRFFAGQQCTY